MVTRASFVASLENVSDVNDHYAFIDRHAEQGDLQGLKEIFVELNNGRPHSRVPDWALRAVLERIVEVLALTAGYDNAITALELVAVVDSRARSGFVRLRPRAVVSKVVAAQSPEVIDRLLRTLSNLETLALVLHEAVVRHKLLPESGAGGVVQDRLVRANHPLASLPITLFDLEEGILLPFYARGSAGASIPFGPTRDKPAVASISLTRSLEIPETTCPERAEIISAAVMNWKDESNGKIEARTFRMSLSQGDTMAAILPRLGLEAVKPTDVIHSSESLMPKEVFTILFAAASNGGAYNQGSFAAYGRLLAWRSLAGLTGALASAPIREIAMSAQSCHWCLFDSPNEWYYQVAWDIGIACINPASPELAVLAATDTD